MKRPMHYAEARRILSRVTFANRFWLCTNENLRNLAELSAALENVNDDIFRYHVNRDRNDFEVWIRDLIGDKELAREISRVKTKETLVRKIKERIEVLRKVVKVHRTNLERKRAKTSKKKAKSRKKTEKKARKAKKVRRASRKIRKSRKAGRKTRRKAKKRRLSRKRR